MSIENFKLNQTLARIVAANTVTPRIIPMLVGEAAIGKSSWARAFAAQNNTEVFIISVNTLADKADVTATKTEIHDDGTVSQRFFPMHTVKRANDYALENPDKLVYIFADEINRADSDVTSAIQTMFTERRNGDLELADNIRFIAAGNDKGNVTQLDSASRTRFSLYHVVPDADIFTNIMGENLNGYIKKVLQRHPDYILCQPSAQGITPEVDGTADDDQSTDEAFAEFSFGEDVDEMSQFTAPRTLEGLSDTLNDLSREELSDLLAEDIGRSNALEQLVYAHIGMTACADDILTVIADDLSTATAQTNSAAAQAAPKRPRVWSVLMNANNRSDIETTISALGAEEAGNLFAYLAYDDGDPKRDDQREMLIVEELLAITDPSKLELNRDTLSNMVILNREGKIKSDVIAHTQNNAPAQSVLSEKMTLMAAVL